MAVEIKEYVGHKPVVIKDEAEDKKKKPAKKKTPADK